MSDVNIGAGSLKAFPKLIVGSLFLVGWLTSGVGGASAQTPTCNRTITADVVAFDQIIFYNRLGSFDPGGMMFALRRDVVPIDPAKPLGPGNAQLRADKRPRPIVLRANEGDCLQVTFTNWLDPNRPDVENLKFINAPDKQPYFGPPITLPDGTVHDGAVKLSQFDTPATRTASMHVNGLDLVGSIDSDGSNVGNNTSSLAAPGQSRVYTWYAKKEGQYLLFSTGATSGGEGDGGQIAHGLFGTVNVEPPGAKWYRSQVTHDVLAAATTGSNPNGTPKINYEAADAGGTPLLNVLKGSEIVHTDLNAVITGFTEDCTKAPPSGTCGQPFREFTIVFHDELETGAPAFPDMLQDESVFHSVRDGFGINYGASGLGSEVLANRKGVGPQANCTECNYEEFFLESWANSDPATLVAYGAPDPNTQRARAIAGLFPDDPSNVHHSYLNDPVRMRNVHAGPKETHIFHLHQHQWLQSPRDENSTYLDSQTISPGASFTYEIQYGGGGNRNLGSPGDSIFHCHLYPHFAQGMWELWRNHDTFEDGTPGLNADAGGSVAGGRNLPDGEIGEGIPQPALVPIPGKPMPPMPTNQFPGFPFYMAGQAGHRAPQAPLGRESTGGLPRHRILSATRVTGPAAIDPALLADPVAARVSARNNDPNLLGFAQKLVSANIELLPENGTSLERTAIQFHQGQGVTGEIAPGTPITTIYDWNGIGYPSFDSSGAAGFFFVNGRAPVEGAPYSDPCPATYVDGNGTRRNTPIRQIRAAWIQFDMTINTAGWHDRQARIAVLEQDVAPTLSGTRPPEPLFIRVNSGDCVDYRVTNLAPANLNLDDFQVYQGTDIIGQHIHLVKFDVTSSDGAGNGWNYESGGFSPEAVRERIEANNAFQQSIGGTQILTPQTNPFFGAGPNGAWIGAQTHIERWWADPLVNNNGKDRTMRTVFTHDHFSPSGHQHHGLYAGLVIEPTDAQWKFPDGTPMGGPVPGSVVRADGGPTSFAANIITADPAQSYREFMFEIGDFAIVYTPTPELQPINPPNRVEHALPVAVGSPIVDDPSQQPLPEAISSADPGTQVVNYRNEPIPLRIGQKVGNQFVQKTGAAGDLANVFDSKVHGDPFTPLLRAYENDRVQVRLLQGAQEEQHVMNIHGVKWLFEPGTPFDPLAVNNSGYTNSQQVGISEHFNFLTQVTGVKNQAPGKGVDYLYQFAASDNLWDGMWGILRTFNKSQGSLAPLPNNPIGSIPSPNKVCPSSAPVRQFFVRAKLARDLLPGGTLSYNDRFGMNDPNAILYVEESDIAALQAGTKKPEPLILRAAAGDCINLTLYNDLPAVLPESDSWNFMPPIVPQFNFNQVKTSNRIGLHPQLLSYKAFTDDGSNVGFNNDSTLAPGGAITYIWYAGDQKLDAQGRPQPAPIEFGATGLRDYGDVIKHSSHAAVGSLIIEPQGSTWTTVGNSRAMADVKNASGALLFREFVSIYQDDLSLQRDGVPMMNIRGTDDSEDSGMKAFNYRSEPLWLRLGFPPETDLQILNSQDYSNTLSSTGSNAGCGGACGDPATPVFTATAGTPVRFRVLDVAGHPRQHGYTLFGHHWNFEPWTQNSTVQGFNPFTFEVGSYSGIGPTRHLNILTTAGGLFRIPGDYLYRTQDSFQFSGGLWGIFRVTP
jgi:hypothetical protein